ncbi:MAG: hypothetical protein CME65_12460 [Halobacteriovoraceae bacterium]|nr:hypothetical protein [Halobacteriovoraceae bacterium]|tara:strand:- start:3854 stop:5665 length:1812 start_codon:yes stop_codon:yes gene_type:complete
MYTLGISAFYHDSAAALIKNGKVIFAAQEERFTRIKGDSNFPTNAIRFLLTEEGITLNDLENIVYYDKPWKKFERIVDTILLTSPRSFKQFLNAMPSWLGEKLYFRTLLKKHFKNIDPSFNGKRVMFSDHHFSHAASCFYTSPFEESAALVVDGVGEWATLSIYKFTKNSHKLLKQMNFPHSIGILYSAFTFYCGFKINSGEYKLMGLAPYGRDKEAIKIQEIIEKNLFTTFDDGSIELNLENFEFHHGLKTINDKRWKELFKHSVRSEEDELTQFYCDFAKASQLAVEKILLKITKHVKEITLSENLCFSGGVALNCVANSKIKEQNLFRNIWIHPAPGDAGGAIGAALGFYFKDKQYKKREDHFNAYLGPEYSDQEILRSIKKFKLKHNKKVIVESIESIAKDLAEGKVLGWFQGKMEWGPRALGNRSILASPLEQTMQKKLNLKIKFREGFRPFAPITIESKAHKYFEPNYSNPYMQFTQRVKSYKKIDSEEFKSLSNIESDFPSITHLDGSARLQTVNSEQNPLITCLLEKFELVTGYPILINTSFNVRGEPIVCSPIDAIRCFLSTEMDILVLGNFILRREENLDAITNFKPEVFNKD